ncbi:MAG TPA: DUF6790 family protein [Gammaproteobacteria bacterium]|jgi:hypothetical protein|nr:DUF6790 family protein [Gammaproteobacteria bacterium]
MIQDYIVLILNNFGLFMFGLAAVFIILHKLIVRGSVSNDEIVYRWMALFPLGCAGIYTFIMHVFYPQIASAVIGWSPSPFEFEVGIANLAFGTIAILSFNASFGFRLATVIANVIWLFGDASQHVTLMITTGNFNIGNAGSWLWLDDLILPMVMLLCINGLYRQQQKLS